MNRLIDNAFKYLGSGQKGKTELIKYYNEECLKLVKPTRRYVMQDSDSWCAMFTSAIARKTGLTVLEFPYEVSVYYQCEIARSRGIYFKGITGAKVGDLIVYDWLKKGNYDHVGIIVKIAPDVIEVIEGNYSDAVKVRKISPHSKAIKGYISLNIPAIPCEQVRIENLVRNTMRGDYGDGMARRVNLGADYHLVQLEINRLYK